LSTGARWTKLSFYFLGESVKIPTSFRMDIVVEN
jgi:hypothetical protein